MGKRFRKTVVLMLGAVLMTAVCTGCFKKESVEQKVSTLLDEIGYDYQTDAASPSREILWENAEKTVTYRVTHHPDATAEEMAKQFEAETEALSKEETTWEQNMWKYHCFCYENEYPLLSDNYTYSSPNWDMPLWKFVKEDTEEKEATETLFFDRADGCYSLTMTYPKENVTAKMVVYHLASEQDFQVDIDRGDKMQEGLSFVDEINENGELVITVTNNGEETVETVSCMVNITGTTDRGTSRQEENVAPGQTATFVIESEHMEGAEDYSVDIYAFFALRAIDSEGEVWNVH